MIKRDDRMGMRLLTSVLLACCLAILGPVFLRGANIARADDATGVCHSTSYARAFYYERPDVLAGASNGGILQGELTLPVCVGLAQTEAIFQAGYACDLAGISPGLVSGVGFATVDWYLEWDDTDITPGGPVHQQYDCADTFF